MTTLLLISESKNLLATFRKLILSKNEDAFLEDTPDGFVIDFDDNRIYVLDADRDIISDYDESEADVILKLIPEPYFYTIHYNSLKFIKKLILSISEVGGLLIDDNFNSITPMNQFAGNIAKDPEWDWRTGKS